MSSESTTIVIASAARTPVGSFNGALASLPAHELGKTAIKGALDRAGVAAGDVSEVIMGQILAAGAGQNPARQASIEAGIPVDAPAWGMNQLCGSGLRAVALGAQQIQEGSASIVVAGGQASMSQEPHAQQLRSGQKMGDLALVDAMIKDGLMDRFGIDQVYGMHNSPGMPIGTFATRAGPTMAATDHINIHIEGLGGHAARPHKSIDSVLVGSQLVVALQSIVSRSVDPLEAVVVSMCQFRAGDARNVIPQTAEILGTARTLTAEMRDLVEQRVREIVAGVALQSGARITLNYERSYPVLVNHAAQVDVAARVAAEVTGAANVSSEIPPVMGAEDFAYMLEARPGAFIFIGNGDSAGLHHPAYDFNDEAIVYGASYWARLVETQLAG